MNQFDVVLVASLLALLFSICTVGFSILSYCKVVGLENSSHKVQYMPLEQYTDFSKELVENAEDGQKVDLEKLEKERKKKLIKGFESAYSTGE